MGRRQLGLRLIVPALLMGLVGWLGALEYHWLDEVSQADRAARRASLLQHAADFADDFDRELSGLYAFLDGASDSVTAGVDPAFAQKYDAWHDTARDPQILKTVYWARRDGNRSVLTAYDPTTRAFGTVSWPADLAPIRTQLESRVLAGNVTYATTGPAPPSLKPLFFARDAVMTSIPAVVLSRARVPGLPTATPTAVAIGMVTGSSDVLVALLDRTYLQSVVLPRLAERFFPSRGTDTAPIAAGRPDAPGADSYRVAVIDSRTPTAPLMTRDWPAGMPVDPRTADATQAFFSLRPELSARLLERMNVVGGTVHKEVFEAQTARPKTQPAGTVVGGQTAATFRLVLDTQAAAGSLADAAPVARPNGGWELVLQNTTGSLDTAVTAARHRNLWLSFGLLSVLSAGILLIVTNAQRSERLARQQMDFVASVSHELRTPLAVIRSAAQNLGAGVVLDPARARQYGELIEGEGRRLTDMVEQVLDYAGLHASGRPLSVGPVDLGAVVADVVSACATLATTAGVTVEQTVEAGVPLVSGDERALRSAVTNLVVNALKYGADGRWLGLTVRAATFGGPAVELLVADRGLGVDAADRRHLFEPFYRGERAIAAQIHGNGLGLSLVKRIAEAHGGGVSLDSSPGAGATFRLVLPAAEAAD